MTIDQAALNSAQRETLEEVRRLLDYAKVADAHRLDQNTQEDPTIYELRIGGSGFGFIRLNPDGSLTLI